MGAPDEKLEAKQEALIYCLLKEKTRHDAAMAAGVPISTMYRWLKDPRFARALADARRERWDDALFVLEKGAQKAAQALYDEIDPQTRTGALKAAQAFLDRAFKAQDAFRVQAVLADLRQQLEDLRNPKPPKPREGPKPMSAEDQAEACRLRVAWMTLLGIGGRDIEWSLRYNRPQSVEEERYNVELVQKMLDAEEFCKP